MGQREHGTGTDTEVAIVGGGVAGLYVAYRLRQASVPFVLLEAEARIGGRVFSRPERHSQLGLMLDEGANLINSTDTLAIELMDRFGITYVRRLKPGQAGMHYVVHDELLGQERFDRLLFQDSPAAIDAIVRDQEVWLNEADRDFDPQFIGESIASYLKRIAAGPVLTTMLKSFFWSEYGHEVENLNLHVLFDYLDIDLTSPCFKLIPNADEAYTLPDGTGQIALGLEKYGRDCIQCNKRVTSIIEKDAVIAIACGDGHRLTARQVFFAAPLHALNSIDVAIDGLAPQAVEMARAATYARGTKLHLKFEPGFERLYRHGGILLTDTGEQIWNSSTGQGGAGLLTVLTGPMPAGRSATVEQAARLLRLLDRISPGLSDLHVGTERSDAPMSYSGSLKPGEVADLAIHDGGTHWITVGEASSEELQGYLEGALRSADAGVARYLARRRALKKMR
jgi:monoamine oxidase